MEFDSPVIAAPLEGRPFADARRVLRLRLCGTHRNRYQRRHGGRVIADKHA